MKKKLITLFATGLFIASCSDGTQKFVGKHTLSLPLYTTKHDTSISIREFGNIVHPQIHYYDVYTSTIDIYKMGDKLEGKLKYVYPDAGKWYSPKSTVQEQAIELKSLHIENDTLLFLIEPGPMSPKFDGCAYMDGGNMVVGLPKKMFTWIIKNRCIEPFVKDSPEFLFFVTDQPADRKTLYKCQLDSLKQFVAANPKYIHKYELDIKYLSTLTH